MSLFGADGANQALGMLGASAISYLAQSHGAYKQYKYQKKLQEHAAGLNYAYGKKTALNQYGWTRQSLENADYNPMLAVSQGPVGMSSGFTSTGSAQSEDYSSAVNSALDYAKYYQDKKLNNATVKKTEADTHLADTQTYRNQIDNYYAPSIAEANLQNIQSATSLQQMQATSQMLENKYIPKKRKAEIYNLYKSAEASLGMSSASRLSSEAQMYSAKTSRGQAVASGIATGLGLSVLGGRYLKGVNSANKAFKALHFINK